MPTKLADCFFIQASTISRKKMSSGENVTSKYQDNPYFDGVVSPITTQGEVTFNCRAEHSEIAQRKSNMHTDAGRAKSYPGGDVIDNLQIMSHELVFGWVNRQGRNAIPGHPNHIGFSSLNGLKYGITSTDEELEQRIRFIGLAKTPFIFENSSQLQSGFTCIGVGTGTTFHTGTHDIYPGDPLYWSVIPRPATRNSLQLEGGKFGDSGPGSRQGTPTTGTPRGKLRFRINPSRFNDMKPSMNMAVSAMLKPMAQGGCADRPFEHLFSEQSLGMAPKPTAQVELAMAMLYTTVVDIIRGIQILKDAGLDLMALDEITLCNQIGIFETTPDKRTLVNALVNGLFLGLNVNRAASTAPLRQLRDGFAKAGFDPQSGRVRRNNTTASRYVQVATNSANYKYVAFSRAVNVEGRKRFATALCFSKPGQRVDILIGHFLQAM